MQHYCKFDVALQYSLSFVTEEESNNNNDETAAEIESSGEEDMDHN